MNFFKLSTFYKLFNFTHKVIHELFSLSNSCTKGIFHKLIKTSVNALNFVFKGESSEQVQRLVVVDLPGALPLETLAWSPVE